MHKKKFILLKKLFEFVCVELQNILYFYNSFIMILKINFHTLSLELFEWVNLSDWFFSVRESSFDPKKFELLFLTRTSLYSYIRNKAISALR